MTILKHLQSRNTESIGRLCVRLLEDHFRVEQLNTNPACSHSCLVYEPLGISLLEYYRSQRTKGLSVEETSFFLLYLTHALDFLHTSGVVHTGKRSRFALLRP
jgi:serine/threonine-protein kinase SRPK3